MRSRPRILTLALTALVLTGAMAACGGDDDDATGDGGDAAEATTTVEEGSSPEAVCAAKDDLRDSVDTVLSDIGDGNLGEARENVEGIETAADSLGQAVEDLSADERDQLEPLVDDLRSTISSLDDSSSLAELGASLDSIGSTLDDIVTELRPVGCD